MDDKTRRAVLRHNNKESVGELRDLTEAELVERDGAVSAAMKSITLQPKVISNYARRVEAYRTELARRETVRQGKRMEVLTWSLRRLTWWIVALTVLIAVATLVGVGLTAWTVLSGA